MTTQTTNRLRGAISALKVDYGYIIGDDGRDRFFHKSMLGNRKFDQLRVNDRVEFTHADAIKGPRAVDVEVIRSAQE
jgi:cold shock CspA family protein